MFQYFNGPARVWIFFLCRTSDTSKPLRGKSQYTSLTNEQLRTLKNALNNLFDLLSLAIFLIYRTAKSFYNLLQNKQAE